MVTYKYILPIIIKLEVYPHYLGRKDISSRAVF
jgi:hypothetical protein